MRSAVQRLMLLPSVLLASTVSFALATSDIHSRQSSSNNASIAPLSIDVDQNWGGIAGNWSTVTLRVGTPAQAVQVLVSFNLYQTWVVAPQGCSSAASPSACAVSRGGIFDPSNSSTWVQNGIYAFAIEQNLGYTGNAQFGYDSVGLGSATQNLPVVKNTTVGAFAVDNFYLGLFGLNPQPTNFTAEGDGSPSYMSLLKQQRFIPSVSFGYTAGASYHAVPASLTLGGYDNARFSSNNNVTFTFASDPERDTVIGLQQISTPSNQDSSPVGTSLLPNAISALLDSSVPEIWLPVEACQAFETEFGLAFDNASGLYLVDDALHQSLLSRNASISFLLGQNTTSGETVTITLPYAAFDQTASPPYPGLTNTSRYFPLRRAQNSTQYTLGRTFLQEAYISVDYETSTFNVSQALFTQGDQQNITTIPPYTGKNPGPYSGSGHSSSNTLSGGDIAGIVIGSVAGIALIIGALVWFLVSRRRSASKDNEKDKLITSSPNLRNSNAPNVFPKAELEGSTAFVPNSSDDDAHMLSAPGSSGGNASNSNSRSPVSPAGAGGPGAAFFSRNASSRYHARNNRDSQASHDSTSTPSGEGTYSSTQSAIALFSPLSASMSHSSASTTTAGPPSAHERILVHEMPGDMPTIGEKDGKALNEKEAHQHREKVYNGVTEPATPVTPTTPAGVATPNAHGFNFNFDRLSAGSSIRPGRRSIVGPEHVAPVVRSQRASLKRDSQRSSRTAGRARPSSEIVRPGEVLPRPVSGSSQMLHRQFSFERNSSGSRDDELYD